MINDITPNLSSVDITNCHRLKGTTSPFILVLKEGENIFSALRVCALHTQLKSASVQALGSLQNITIGYYRHDTCQHQVKLFQGIYEIATLIGSITFKETEPFIHIHAGISHHDFIVYGGHVIDAESGPASEFIIYPMNAMIHRKYNSNLGIWLICEENTHE